MRTLVVAILIATPAAASKGYPEVLQNELDLPAKPPCTLCHRTEQGGANTAVRPFGVSMSDLGAGKDNVGALRAALGKSRSAAIDSDSDGVGDIDELVEGRDPNVPEVVLGDGGLAAGPAPELPLTLQTGCVMAPYTRHKNDTRWAWVLLASVVCLGSRKRFRRNP